MVGGRLGRTPYIGPTIKPSLAAARLFSCLEAVLRIYNRQGRRDNPNKARVKMVVAPLGAEEFAPQVEAQWEKIGAAGDRPDTELGRLRAAFTPGKFAHPPAPSQGSQHEKADHSVFA